MIGTHDLIAAAVDRINEKNKSMSNSTNSATSQQGLTGTSGPTTTFTAPTIQTTPTETPQPDSQVGGPNVPTLQAPLAENITVTQTLIPPALSSDVASVSVDIYIDDVAERYEINWVTV